MRRAPEMLDLIFAELADGTRRGLLSRLSDGEATVGELAEPLHISPPAVSKHLRVPPERWPSCSGRSKDGRRL